MLSATPVCAERYLHRVLAVSPAAVIVVLGRPARNAIRARYEYADPGVVSRPLDVEGIERRLVLLAHPNARGGKYPKTLAPADARELRRLISTTD